jgi:hypothetical protein
MAIHQFHSTVDQNYKRVESFKDFAEGTTLYVGNRDTRIMSDVWGTEYYALYWDAESKSVKHAHLDTYEWTRSNDGYSQANATVDATEEVWKQVENFYIDQYLEQYRGEALREAGRIVKDSIVKVVSGRYSKGSVGKVVVVLERAYGMGYRSTIEHKLGIATSEVMVDKIVNGKVYRNYRDIVWAWARNCALEVVPDIDRETVRNRAVLSGASKVAGLRQGRS